MDPNVLTLSLGSWMALPGLPYTPDDSTDSQRRASAGSVARYYEKYVKEMHLEQNFKSGISIISIERINKPNIEPTNLSIQQRKPKVDTIIQTLEPNRRKCSFVSALNFIRSRTKCHKQKTKDQFQICAVPRTCKRPRDRDRDCIKYEQMSPNRKMRDLLDRKYLSVDFSRMLNSHHDEEHLYYCDENTLMQNRAVHLPSSPPDRTKLRSLSFSCDSDFEKTKNTHCDSNRDNEKHTSLLDINECRDCSEECVPEETMEVLCECASAEQSARWLVTGYDNTTGRQVHYTCRNLVLANGASDLPNRLGLPAETHGLPWLLHNLRTLETKLDEFVGSVVGSPDPVLVIGAGLSAADAVIATRFRNIPVIHVFRNRSVSLDKQLPENFYPEYHKVGLQNLKKSLLEFLLPFLFSCFSVFLLFCFSVFSLFRYFKKKINKCDFV